MKQYIGTKIIEAAPAIRKGGKVYDLTWPIPKSMEPEEPGYRVRYPDGYESWSPKDVFEEAYRPTDAMNFGQEGQAYRPERVEREKTVCGACDSHQLYKPHRRGGECRARRHRKPGSGLCGDIRRTDGVACIPG